MREWLAAQAAGGYVDVRPRERPLHAAARAGARARRRGQPGVHARRVPASTARRSRTEPRSPSAFRTGDGLRLARARPRAVRGHRALLPARATARNLVESWIPALDGVEEKLRAGATVADVGCGHGASTILMAQAYPASTFVGFDYHEASIEAARARGRARRRRRPRRVRGRAGAKDYPGRRLRPRLRSSTACTTWATRSGRSRHVRETLADDGTWMVVEPFAGDRVEDNLNPVGRVFYARLDADLHARLAATRRSGLALGAQAGEARLREVAEQAGFSRFRRATETPFNLVLEARP